MTFEWSLTGEEDDYTTLVEYYTNRGQRFCIEHEFNPMTMRDECVTEGFGAWHTLSNFEQPETGIKFLRVTSTSNEARLTELFICGRPGCADDDLVVAPVCNTADFATCAESTFFNELVIQGNSEIETHLPNNFSNFNYPSSFFNERGPNQLIPGVAYAPVVETCSGGNCSTETLSFTVPSIGDCVLNYAPVDPSDRFLGGCTNYSLAVDPAAEGQEIQLWISYDGPFNNSSTDHPLVQNSNAEMQVLPITFNPLIGWNFRFFYEECGENVYIAYRYISDDKSSGLHTLNLTAGTGPAVSVPWQLHCVCDQSSPYLLIEDCIVTDIVYDYLEVGEKLRHREIARPSVGPQQLLKTHTHNISDARYIYHLSHPEDADRLRFRVSDSSPWLDLDLNSIPCITTSDSPTATKNDQTTEAEANITLENDLTLYPNPTRDYLNVGIGESANLLLIGVDGKSHDLRELKKTSFGYQFSTSHLTPGLYLLRTIDNAGKVQTGKFLVRE